MKMIRVLFGTLIAVWLVAGCAMEEPDSSGALSLDPNYGEPPEGVSIQDVDIIKDGFIDMKDLVAVAHFYQQEVPDSDVVETSSDTTTSDTDYESTPCRDIKLGLRFPKIKVVDDNTEFKETFVAPDGNRYVYALVAVPRMAMYRNLFNQDITILLPVCLALRFLVSNDLTIKNVKMKPVAQQKNMFSRTIEISLSRTADEDYYDGYKTRRYVKYVKENERWEIMTAWNIVSNPPIPAGKSEGLHNRNKEEALRIKKLGIPIGDGRVIYSFSFDMRDREDKDEKGYFTNSYIRHQFAILEVKPKGQIYRFQNDSEYMSKKGDRGAYIKMLPAEVRRRYFPEDIDE